jgi:hypothetical protein
MNSFWIVIGLGVLGALVYSSLTSASPSTPSPDARLAEASKRTAERVAARNRERLAAKAEVVEVVEVVKVVEAGTAKLVEIAERPATPGA